MSITSHVSAATAPTSQFGWVLSGLSSGVIYVCATQPVAERVRIAGEDAKLSIERGTFRIELLDTIKRQAVEVRGGVAEHDWGMLKTGSHA